MILASGLSDVGCKRTNNQDRIWIDLQIPAFILADGMGGENCGGLAAEVAVNTLATYFRGPAEAADSWQFGYDSQADLASNRMATAIQLANLRIRERSLELPECREMGSTVSAVTISGKIATVGTVGDSRVYIFRSRELLPVTKDDSIVAKLLDAGEISAEVARVHPMRNVLTQAAGKMERLVPQIHQVQLHHDDRLLLSSDGLHGVISHDSIADILSQGDDVEVTVRRLIAEGRKLGAPDNLSCVLIEILAEG